MVLVARDVCMAAEAEWGLLNSLTCAGLVPSGGGSSGRSHGGGKGLVASDRCPCLVLASSSLQATGK
jgi:hypothetical protein